MLDLKLDLTDDLGMGFSPWASVIFESGKQRFNNYWLIILVLEGETMTSSSSSSSIFVFMAFLALLLFSTSTVLAKKSGDVTDLQIGVKFKPESCVIQAHKGDRIKVHYRGKLTDGTVFDSSFERGDPIEFELGGGQVIKGWDQGLLGMCVGEKRKLKIPAKLGYGPQGSPPTIPGGATLIFDAELVAVNGKTSGGGKSAGADSDL